MTEFSIDFFDYESAFENSTTMYILLLVIFVAAYIVLIPTVLYLLQNGKKGMAVGFIIFMLIPFFGITQTIGILTGLVVLLYYARKERIKRFMNPLLFLFITVLYGFSCYFMILNSLFLFGNANLYEIQNQHLYRKTEIDLKELVKKRFIPPAKEKRIRSEIQQGKEHVSSKRIVIGLLTKNGAKHVLKVKEKLDRFCKYFADYRVIIFENDSTDNTRDILKEWANTDPRVVLLECPHLGSVDCQLQMKDPKSDGYTSFSRSEKMAFYRQEILNEVQKNYTTWDYFCTFDFDLSGAFFIDGFLTTFSNTNWDMVYGNGISFIPLPFLHAKPYAYDCFAFVDNRHKFGLEAQVPHFFQCNKILGKATRDMKWYKSKSGFNGIAIYKISSLQGASYTPKKGLLCEHVFLHASMIENGRDKIFFNPAMILFPGQQCEHRLQMVLQSCRDFFKNKK
jgi:glycosyltransferase involved in cell wall biosynthesis